MRHAQLGGALGARSATAHEQLLNTLGSSAAAANTHSPVPTPTSQGCGALWPLTPRPLASSTALWLLGVCSLGGRPRHTDCVAQTVLYRLTAKGGQLKPIICYP